MSGPRRHSRIVRERAEILVFNERYRQLPVVERDAFARSVITARLAPSTIEDVIRHEEMVKPHDASVVLIAPNPAVNYHWRDQIFEAGSAMANLGSVFAQLNIPTIVCGFLSREQPAARLFRVLASKRGVNTGHCTEIVGECGITVYTEPDRKLTRTGPLVTEEERVQFLGHLKSVLEEINPQQPPVVVVSGSAPLGEQPESMVRLHADIIQLVRRREARQDLAQPILVMVDTREPHLYWAVLNHPDYLKVTREELGQLLCTLFDRDDEFKDACRAGEVTREELPNFANSAPAIAVKYLADHKGIATVVVSGGGDGAWQVWRESQKVIHCRPSEELRETVWPAGAGDTLVASHAMGHVSSRNGRPTKFGALEEGVAASYVACTKKGSASWSAYDEVIAHRKIVRRQELRLPPRVELRASHERLETARDQIAKFLEICASMKTRPLVVADMDDTMTDAGHLIKQPCAEAVADVAERGMTFATLTSSSWPAVQRQLLDAINADRDLQKRFRRLYRRMPILVNQGSMEYQWRDGTYRQHFSLTLRRHFGPKNLASLMMTLVQAVKRFSIKSTAGELIEDRGTQLTLYVLGIGATREQKIEYFGRYGRGPRLEYARWINDRLHEQGIPAHASVGGQSSIDVAPVGVNKGFGICRLAKSLDRDLRTVIYFADEFGTDSIDDPVARAGVLSINVGPAIRDLDSPVWTTEQYGTTGFIEHMKQISDSLR